MQSDNALKLGGFSEIAARYDTVFCDIWGVVHNGVRPYNSAVKALRSFREKGGQVALISNSPLPSEPLIRHLEMMGVDPFSYDVVISSGETTRAILKARAGQRVFFIGPESDRIIYDGTVLQNAGAEEAEFILSTALYPHMAEDPEAYCSLLAPLAARGLEFICANPDLMVEVGGRLYHEAGAIAQIYEELGGKVIYTGKPHAPIYETASRALIEKGGKTPQKSRSIAIGDSLRTDMRGAKGQGMDGLLISAGVHEVEVGDTPLEEVFKARGVSPVALMPVLAW